MQPPGFSARNELRFVGADGVEVRRKQDGLADLVSWQQARDDIGTTGQNLLKFHFQSGARRRGGQKIRNALFAGKWMTRW